MKRISIIVFSLVFLFLLYYTAYLIGKPYFVVYPLHPLPPFLLDIKEMKIDLKLVLAIIFVLFLCSFPLIWSMNVLFHLNIPYSFESVFASLFLLGLLKSK